MTAPVEYPTTIMMNVVGAVELKDDFILCVLRWIPLGSGSAIIVSKILYFIELAVNTALYSVH